jgi:hypothetical protein
MGLDLLPAWFLRLGTPAFYKPIAMLFNLSLANSYVPHQWKKASILPIPKTSEPKLHADFRPIQFQLVSWSEQSYNGSCIQPSCRHLLHWLYLTSLPSTQQVPQQLCLSVSSTSSQTCYSQTLTSLSLLLTSAKHLTRCGIRFYDVCPSRRLLVINFFILDESYLTVYTVDVY